MVRANSRLSLSVKLVVGALALITLSEPAWAILGVWRRAAVTTAVVSTAVVTSEAAAANAAASKEAAAAASAQQAAAASAASAASAQQAAAQTMQKSPQQKWQELQSLYDQKLISAADYQAAKTKILNGL
ncbi:MAG: SHOCT domain-containing protein [Dechloromonas sp.]|nr:SHOCT domain-containing protein [Dechloromonas sp.]